MKDFFKEDLSNYGFGVLGIVLFSVIFIISILLNKEKLKTWKDSFLQSIYYSIVIIGIYSIVIALIVDAFSNWEQVKRFVIVFSMLIAVHQLKRYSNSLEYGKLIGFIRSLAAVYSIIIAYSVYSNSDSLGLFVNIVNDIIGITTTLTLAIRIFVLKK